MCSIYGTQGGATSMASSDPIAFLFYGEDEPTLRDHVASFIDGLNVDDFNTTRLVGKDVRAGEVEAAAASLPFINEFRLVLVENASENSEDLLDALPEMLGALPGWARVVFVETDLKAQSYDSQSAGRRKSSRKKVVKKLAKIIENDPRGVARSFDLPKNAVDWILQRAEGQQIDIERNAAHLLAERIGEDFILADTELVKLSTYAGDRAISREDVDALTPYTAEASIFNLVDSIGQRNGRVALSLLENLLEDQKQEPLYILSMIARQYRLLIELREYMDSGGTQGGAANALGMRGFVVRKLSGQMRHYKLEQLERIYIHLSEQDVEIKTGKIDSKLALEMFVTRLAR